MEIKRWYLNAIVVCAVIGSSYANPNVLCTPNEKKSCTSKDCLRSATMLVESMNRSVNPCDDFYKFACDNFAEHNGIPKTSLSNDRFAELKNIILILIRDYLEKDYNETYPYSVVQARTLYRSCTATDEIDAAGLTQLFELLDKIGLPRSGFPDKKYSQGDKKLNLTTILAGLKKHLNMDYLFRMSVIQDPKNRTVNRITLDRTTDNSIFPLRKTTEKMGKINFKLLQDKLKINNDDHKNKTAFNVGDLAYFNYFKTYFKGVWEIFKQYTNTSNLQYPRSIDHQIAELIYFRVNFTEINNEVYDTNDQLPTIMTVDEFQKFTDDITHKYNTSQIHQIINWKVYFNILFADVENVSLDFTKDKIQVNNIDFFEALFKLMAKHGKNLSIVHLWWEVVENLIPYTTNQLRFQQDTFFYKTLGLEHNPSRSMYCANVVNEMMGMAVSYLLVENQPLDRYQTMVNEMMDNIYWAFEKTVKELKWMDAITKDRTILKARKMKTLVGYPEFVQNPAELDDYYYGYDIRDNDYFGNVIRYLQLELNTSLVLLRSINNYNVTTWVSDPLHVNSFNEIYGNTITIPAGILRFPFFAHDLQFLNYGILGSIVGHELTHGFDNSGRKFDQEGNVNIWWTNQTINEYENRSACFVKHYESYTVPGSEEKINGLLTLDENIADNGGLKQSFWAYRKFVTDHGEEPRLTGLDEFSNEQNFFLAYASTWCEVTTEESISDSLLDEHSPNHIRVIAALINSEEFSQVWNCKKGSRMNPSIEKCAIW